MGGNFAPELALSGESASGRTPPFTAAPPAPIFRRKMQIVRGCDAKRNVLIYMAYSDKLIEGSPQNSTSTVPIMPWGGVGEPAKCADWIK